MTRLVAEEEEDSETCHNMPLSPPEAIDGKTFYGRESETMEIESDEGHEDAEGEDEEALELDGVVFNGLRLKDVLNAIPTPLATPELSPCEMDMEQNTEVELSSMLSGASDILEEAQRPSSAACIVSEEQCTESELEPVPDDSWKCDGVMVKLKADEYLMDLLLGEDQEPVPDTIITLADGKLGAHRLVLASASEFLACLLMEQDSKSCGTIILPDISKRTMELLLTLAYTGSVFFLENDQVPLMDAINTLYFGANLNHTLFLVPPPEKPAETKSSAGVGGPNEQNVSMTCEPITSSTVVPGPSGTTQDLQCDICGRSFPNESRLKIHLGRSHKQTLATFEEMRVLSYCHGCNTQYKTLDRAQKCLFSHGLSRCWTCFEVAPKTEIKSHYMLNHCDELSASDCHNTFIRCRWCPKLNNIKAGISYLGAHSKEHIPPTQWTKGGKFKSSENLTVDVKPDLEGIDYYEAPTSDGKTVSLRFETLKGEETLKMEQLSAAISIRRRYVARPASVQKKSNEQEALNMAGVQVLVNRLPTNIEDKIFRRVPIPLMPPTPGFRDVTMTTDTEDEHNASAYFAEDTLPDIPRLNTQSSGGNRKDKRKDKGRVSVPSGSPLTLTTEKWGQLNFVVQNLTTEFGDVPEKGMLMVGKDSARHILKTMRKKSKNAQLEILAMYCLDENLSSRICTYLADNNSIGIITFGEVDTVLEILFLPLTQAYLTRLGEMTTIPPLLRTANPNILIGVILRQRPSPPASVVSSDATTLSPCVSPAPSITCSNATPLPSQVSSSSVTPLQQPKTSKRGRKRHRSPRATPTPVSSSRASHRSIRTQKRPRVFATLNFDDEDSTIKVTAGDNLKPKNKSLPAAEAIDLQQQESQCRLFRSARRVRAQRRTFSPVTKFF